MLPVGSASREGRSSLFEGPSRRISDSALNGGVVVDERRSTLWLCGLSRPQRGNRRRKRSRKKGGTAVETMPMDRTDGFHHFFCSSDVLRPLRRPFQRSVGRLKREDGFLCIFFVFAKVEKEEKVNFTSSAHPCYLLLPQRFNYTLLHPCRVTACIPCSREVRTSFCSSFRAFPRPRYALSAQNAHRCARNMLVLLYLTLPLLSSTLMTSCQPSSLIFPLFSHLSLCKLSDRTARQLRTHPHSLPDPQRSRLP
jgi:hypothetical protein